MLEVAGSIAAMTLVSWFLSKRKRGSLLKSSQGLGHTFCLSANSRAVGSPCSAVCGATGAAGAANPPLPSPTNSFSASSPLPAAPRSATTMSLCGLALHVVPKASVKDLREKWPMSAATGLEKPLRVDQEAGAGRKVPEVSPIRNDRDPSPWLTATTSFTGTSQSASLVHGAWFLGPPWHVATMNWMLHLASSHRSPMPL